MKFKHVPNFNLPELKAELRDNGRFYETPGGIWLPSVTTVIGAASDKSWLDDWIARVGEEEAKKVSAQAARRGTAVHDLAEKYLKNDPAYKKGHMPVNIKTFLNIKHFLDNHIGLIAGLELPLYSVLLQTAGRVDCIAKWDGEWSVIDFKTSKKEKSSDDIHNYFLQESAYAYMFYELTGLIPKQLVTVMTVDEGESKVFIEKTRDWIPKFIELRKTVNL